MPKECMKTETKNITEICDNIDTDRPGIYHTDDIIADQSPNVNRR